MTKNLIKIVTIESCEDCPHLDYDTLRIDGLSAYCDKVGRDVQIGNHGVIDEYCPLDDYILNEK